MLGKCYCLTLPLTARNVLYPKISLVRNVSVAKARPQSALFTSDTLVRITNRSNAVHLLPTRSAISGARLVATDNKQGKASPTAKDKKSSESGSILVKLLEEEQQQKAVTVGQRGMLLAVVYVCVCCWHLYHGAMTDLSTRNQIWS